MTFSAGTGSRPATTRSGGSRRASRGSAERSTRRPGGTSMDSRDQSVSRNASASGEQRQVVHQASTNPTTSGGEVSQQRASCLLQRRASEPRAGCRHLRRDIRVGVSIAPAPVLVRGGGHCLPSAPPLAASRRVRMPSRRVTARIVQMTDPYAIGATSPAVQGAGTVRGNPPGCVTLRGEKTVRSSHRAGSSRSLRSDSPDEDDGLPRVRLIGGRLSIRTSPAR
jgi:hypothetical protein